MTVVDDIAAKQTVLHQHIAEAQSALAALVAKSAEIAAARDAALDAVDVAAAREHEESLQAIENEISQAERNIAAQEAANQRLSTQRQRVENEARLTEARDRVAAGRLALQQGIDEVTSQVPELRAQVQSLLAVEERLAADIRDVHQIELALGKHELSPVPGSNLVHQPPAPKAPTPVTEWLNANPQLRGALL